MGDEKRYMFPGHKAWKKHSRIRSLTIFEAKNKIYELNFTGYKPTLRKR